MSILADGLVAFLASIGLCAIFWAAIRAFFYPRQAHQRTVTVICAREDGNDLEEQVIAFSLLHGSGNHGDTLLLVDCGLTEEGRTRCALLSGRNSRVMFCTKDEIHQYIT